jgi:hypothetical protein
VFDYWVTELPVLVEDWVMTREQAIAVEKLLREHAYPEVRVWCSGRDGDPLDDAWTVAAGGIMTGEIPDLVARVREDFEGETGLENLCASLEALIDIETGDA